MDPFAFVRFVFTSLRRVFLGVRRRHSSVFPPTVDLRRKRIRLCASDSSQPDQPGPEKTLGVLLDEYEDLLLRVLLCLVDDGLHECRRVCRRWRDACGKLPVKLGSFCLFQPYRAAEFFPEAVSLHIETHFGSNDALGRLAIQHLSRLRNLRNLSLFMTSPKADVYSLTDVLHSTDCLRSFEISVRQTEKLNELVHVIRFLTNLEALTVHVFRFVQTDLAPVTELQRLKYLKTGFSVIFNSRRELLFPSLTRLTHLHLRSVDEDEPHISFSLQVSKSRRRISYLETSVFLVYATVFPDTAGAQTGSFPSGSGSVVGRRASLEGVLASVKPLG